MHLSIERSSSREVLNAWEERKKGSTLKLIESQVATFYFGKRTFKNEFDWKEEGKGKCEKEPYAERRQVIKRGNKSFITKSYNCSEKKLELINKIAYLRWFIGVSISDSPTFACLLPS